MARSEAPQDPRPYIRVSTDLPLHPKLAALDPAAGWTYIVSLCYCGQSLTDGNFPMSAVLRIAGTPMAIAEALVEQGLWHLPGHDCADCDQPRAGHAVVHDYLQHQRSSAEVRELTEKRRAAGRRGAAARWGDTPKASAMANGKQEPWQTDGNTMAEERRGEEIEKKTSSSSPRAGKPREVTDDDPDFSAFWSAYPRKEDKGHARKAWRTAIKKAQPDAIIAGSQRYASTCAGARTERRFIALPATWLNGERWADQPAGATSSAAWWDN